MIIYDEIDRASISSHLEKRANALRKVDAADILVGVDLQENLIMKSNESGDEAMTQPPVEESDGLAYK